MQAALRRLLRCFGVSFGLAASAGWAASGWGVVAQSGPLRVEVAVPASVGSQPVDGRMLLMLSTDPSGEPRFQVSDGVKTQQVFGVDVEGLAPGQAAVFDAAVLGYPVASLDQVPPGTYTVQALLHRYETFRRADGHTVRLPMDRGEGQQWNRAPGNLFSTPRKVAIDAKRGGTVRLVLDQVIPAIPDPPDTKYVKHVRIQSDLLTKFWGRPMFLGAHVLLPEGWDTHPQARYPLVIDHGHFPYDFDGFREDASRPGPEARAQRPLQLAGLQPDRTGVRPPVLQGLDRPGLPAVPDHRDSACEPVLRRFVHGELGEPRPLWGRDRQGADSLHRDTIPGHGAGMGTVHVRGIDGRLGGHGRPGLLPRQFQRRLHRLPRPDRLPRLHDRQPLRGARTRTTAKAPGGRWRGPATATIWAMSIRPSAT